MKTAIYDESKWRLVPLVATHEMCSAPDSVWHPEAKVIWSQMLEASPQPPAAEEGLEGGGWVEKVIASALALISDAEEVETEDGIMQVAQLHLWHALEDAIEKVGPAEIANFAHPQRDAADAADAEELNRLRIIHAEGITEDMLCAILPGCYYMDPPDGGDTSIYEQLKRMAADAARYRWLRNDHNGDLCAGHEQGNGYVHILDGSRIDEAIDAAMAAGRGEVG